MKTVINIVAILLGVIGLVWFFQGIGVIKGSFMTDDSMWSVIGIICIIVAVGLYYYNQRRQSSAK